MIEYKNRTYREHLQKERWYSFTVAYKETDLWIGIDQASFQESIPTFTESRIRTLRESMDAYLQNDPDYATSLVSYEAKPGAPTIFVENGGDIYANIQENIDIAVFAGTSPLSKKVGFTIQADQAPLGICTSSGTVGPSLSFGKADAVMIICKDCALADTYATAFANEITTTDDIAPCIEKIGKTKDILAAICIKDDKIGIHGIFDLKLFHSKL